MASIYDWSKTAADNASSDSGLTWAEGQAPSTVNDSARMMMARIAQLMGDVGGAVVAGGTPNGITVTANSGFTTYEDGRLIAFKATADNTGSTTLNVNSIGAKPVRKITIDGGTALSAGNIKEDGIYIARYNASLNSGAGAWQLLNSSFDDSQQFPSGTSMLFYQAAAPTGWTKVTGFTSAALRLVDDGGGTATSGRPFTQVFSENYTVDGTVAGHSLTQAEMPTHFHGSGSLSAANHTHGSGSLTAASSGNHRHQLPFRDALSGGAGGITPDESSKNSTTTFTDYAGNHTHNITGTTGGSGTLTVSGTTGDSGGGNPHNHGWSGSVDLGVRYADVIIATKD